MKNWILSLMLVSVTVMSNAQNTTPPFKQNPVLPQLFLIQSDSAVLTTADLKKAPTLIMFFSPSCDHCQKQWAEMVKYKEQLKDIQIIMATYQPFEEMVEFYEKEHIAAKWPNIRLGRDVNYKLVPFFAMRAIPYQALYDRNGKLLTTFESNVDIQKMLDAFKGK